jgi:hypothetical protein
MNQYSNKSNVDSFAGVVLKIGKIFIERDISRVCSQAF